SPGIPGTPVQGNLLPEDQCLGAFPPCLLEIPPERSPGDSHDTCSLLLREPLNVDQPENLEFVLAEDHLLDSPAHEVAGLETSPCNPLPEFPADPWPSPVGIFALVIRAHTKALLQASSRLSSIQWKQH